MMGIPTLVRIADALRVEPRMLLDGVTVEVFALPSDDGRRRA